MSITLWSTRVQGSGKTARLLNSCLTVVLILIMDGWIRAAAALGGIPIELPAAYKHYVDNTKPEFLAKFPHGKIPGLETADGFKLFESVAIARYVAALAPDSGLLGKDLKESALVDQWIHLAESEIDLYTSLIGNLIRGVISPYSKAIHTTFAQRQLRALQTLNTHLASHTFFVGERITLADIHVAMIIQRTTWVTFDAPLRKQLNHLVRHLETIINQPLFRDIFTPVAYVEKALGYMPPKKDVK
ncbi:putative elongation factor 1-gamma 1 [Hypsizygus marmoreus]|uniref:Elongation factor 1-gamma 1 n=1 Tax=Hypsizygus marmoreus TaxID=39966 RepID=A0A369J937_HYPMA|nr:putative elongation factor 1-gamma 1 [Hypsizygus marmoreus]